MSYIIALDQSDILKAAHACIYCQINYYSERRVKPRDPKALMRGWMAQQAVGKYHYLDESYDVNDWIHTGKGDVEDGSEIRCNPEGTLWLGASDLPDQRYWLVMPVLAYHFRLLGRINREDVAHLEQASERDATFIKIEQLKPYIYRAIRPQTIGAKSA